MFNDFVKQTLEFLRTSDINLNYPNIEPVEFLPDGRRFVTSSDLCVGCSSEIRNNIPLCISIMFSLLDYLVDRRVPDLEGASFRKRYSNLPSSDDYDSMFKEIYRIMKLVRNAIVHSRNSVSASDEVFNVDYVFGSTHYRLTMTMPALRLVFSFIWHYSRVRDYPYITGILRTFYDDILSMVSCYSDEFGESLFCIDDEGLRINRVRRYRVKNPDYQINYDMNRLEFSRYPLADFEKKWAGADYYVSINEELYLVPDETLDDDSSIPICELQTWLYFSDRFF